MPNPHKYINLHYLNSITDGDKDLIKELIAIFIEQIPEFRDGLNESFEQKDWNKIAAIAHKAKSSVISMGMDELGNKDLKNLELLAKLHTLNELKEKTPDDDRIVQLQKTIDSYPEDRKQWLFDNNNNNSIKNIIDHFNSTCENAIIELNKILDN